MSDKQLRMIVEGLPDTSGHVDLKIFLTELSALKTALSRIDKSVSNQKESIQFLVTELSHSSPASITLSAAPKKNSFDYSINIFTKLENTLSSIVNDVIPEDADYTLLESFRTISKPIGKSLSSLTLLVDEKEYNIDSQFNRNIEAALERGDSCIGSIEGSLEQINLHGDQPHFTIYPNVGPNKVKCIFHESLHDDAVNSLEKRVIVSGTLFYRPKADFPHEINVDSMIVNPLDHELPTFEDLLGLASNVNNMEPSEVVIRELRDEWD